MPEQPSVRRPIQVFLNTKQFLDVPEPQQFPRASKDFFKGNNKGFVEHKKRLKTRVESVAAGLRQNRRPAGFVKVKQRDEALAKSYRPMGHLFSEANAFALVGADRLGELLFQATPSSLEHLAQIIETKAEEAPATVRSKKTGLPEVKVSPYRSELGGIEDIQIYGAPDKIKFSAEDAVAWMRQPNVIGGYIVELFRPDSAIGLHERGQMVSELRHGLEKFPGGLIIRPFLPSSATPAFGEPTLALSVQLTVDNRRLIELPFLPDGGSVSIAEASLPDAMRGGRADLSLRRHTDLLSALAEQSLVRAVELPPVLETTLAPGGASTGQIEFPSPVAGVDYPVVGIVDGGVTSDALNPWKVGDAGLVPPGDRDEAHATFIAGLVVGASALNPVLSGSLEQAGCRFYDLDLFPRRELRHQYYSDIEDLFDTLDEKVKVAKRDHGVRVFNLSFSIGVRASRLSYTLAADRLDRIARANDVIFVVAAGNLLGSRPPWPEKAEDAAVMLAEVGSNDQQITSPSEHVLGLTVGAVNPPGVAGHVPLVPTTYTRRGPGVGGARKPDLAHFGGADTINFTGLVSLNTDGDTINNRGTSFASPLVAATVASLDHRLAGQASREILLALPIHRAKRADSLNRPSICHVSREFVGFGMAPPADAILNDDPHSVTLVFTERLLAKQQLEFQFAWPRSLIGEHGTCRGRAEVTLSYTPPIDPDHKEEAIRVQLEAHLQQEKLNEETGEVSWEGRLSHDASNVPQTASHSESTMIKMGIKWSPLKRYQISMPAGRGNSSNWRLSLTSLVRGGFAFPSDGVPFCLVLTISDLDGVAGVREEMRLDFASRGLVLADITVAHRVRAR